MLHVSTHYVIITPTCDTRHKQKYKKPCFWGTDTSKGIFVFPFRVFHVQAEDNL